LKFVVTHPDRVLSGAVCAAGWGFQRPTPENLAFTEVVAREFERGEAGSILTRLGGYIDRPLNFVERLGVRAALALTNDRFALAALTRNACALDVTEEQLRANKVPVLTMIGDQDGLFSGAQALHAHMACNELAVLPGATHGSAGGYSAFMENLQDFLRRNTPKPDPGKRNTDSIGEKDGSTIRTLP
jgi:pimeloyl-ACP methyl ester carboxylesterase